MGVFAVSDALRIAAIDAAHELGVFTAASEPRTLAALAAELGVKPRRLGALLDVLVAIGVVTRDDAGFVVAEAPRWSESVMTDGWGALPAVIRTDTPVPIDPALTTRYHGHLLVAGAAAAREVAAMIDAASVADLGGGAGTYARAILERDAATHVTVVDSEDVIALARRELAGFADRVAYVAGDIRDARVTCEAALLANVLHLHGPRACAELCAAAAATVPSGGVVAIVDLRLDEDRRAPIEGVMFALNMAVYTDEGSVYTAAEITAWLAAAGLVAFEERRLESAPEMIVVLARKP